MQLTTVVALFTVAFSILQGAQAQGGFSRTCTGIYIENNNFLRATCGNGQGGQVDSALNLDACIGIDGNNVNLVCRPNGNYAANGCRSCLIRTGTYMLCMCPGGNKIANLGECVANRSGLLACA